MGEGAITEPSNRTPHQLKGMTDEGKSTSSH